MTTPPLVFIDGDQGTTGLQIHERLRGRMDLQLLTLPEAERKNATRRAEAINSCDIAILCLPDAPAREAAAAIVNPAVRVIDASSAHRTDPQWVYGFPEMGAAQAARIAGAKRVSNPGCYPTGAIALLRPLVDEKNTKLLKSRERLLKIKEEWDGSATLTGVNKRNLARLREKFHVTYETYPEDARAIEILLLRVDVIPPAMVMAQAAVESGWGTSRFAEEAHNLFGHWCYKPGCGLVPSRRAANAKHEVKKFNNVEESLTAYFNNINTHNAYRPWRQLRAQLRHDETRFTGSTMVAELGKYSSRGPAYIHELRTVIRSNRLE